MMVARSLHDVARFASEAFPFEWIDSPASVRDRVVREGRAGRLDVRVETRGDDARVFRSTATLRVPIPQERREEVELLCHLANALVRTACFHVSSNYGGLVCSSASIVLTGFRDQPDPKLLENLIARALFNGLFIEPIVERVLDGLAFTEAIGIETEVMRDLIEHPPACLPLRGPLCVGEEAIIDACEVAAKSVEVKTRRRRPDQLLTHLIGSPSSGSVTTYVDVLDDCIVTCSYPLRDAQSVPRDRVGAVLRLVTLLRDEERPYAISVAPELGSIQVRTVLDLAGVAELPPDRLLVDVMTQSAVGAAAIARPVLRAAHGVDGQPSTEGTDRPSPRATQLTGGSLRERLIRRQAT